ncbi:MAG: (d)CMP kinase [Bacteroidota bacterium]
MKKINIAIDGYSSCGKGTLAKALAIDLNYIFIDTGAMYRAVTYAVLQNDIRIADEESIIELLPGLNITFDYIPSKNYYHTILNGEDIENEIRGMAVSNLVSPVSKIKEVRTFLVSQQQALGRKKGVVMDGRDIGTVVFPDAELKIFMTARPEIRAQRRYAELQQKGNTAVSYQDVLNNLTARDMEDSSRLNSPLKAAADAIILDNSEMTREEQHRLALKLALEKVQSLIH